MFKAAIQAGLGLWFKVKLQEACPHLSRAQVDMIYDVVCKWKERGLEDNFERLFPVLYLCLPSPSSISAQMSENARLLFKTLVYLFRCLFRNDNSKKQDEWENEKEFILIDNNESASSRFTFVKMPDFSQHGKHMQLEVIGKMHEPMQESLAINLRTCATPSCPISFEDLQDVKTKVLNEKANVSVLFRQVAGKWHAQLFQTEAIRQWFAAAEEQRDPISNQVIPNIDSLCYPIHSTPSP